MTPLCMFDPCYGHLHEGSRGMQALQQGGYRHLHEDLLRRRDGGQEEAKQQEAAAKAARLQEMQERLAAWQAQQSATQN